MKERQNNINSILISIAILAVFLFLIGLLYRPVLLFLLLMATIGFLTAGIYLALRKLKKKPQHLEIMLNIRAQLGRCEIELHKNQTESEKINDTIKELTHSLEDTTKLDDKNREESERILAAFYKELELREAKVDFYATCKAKLETLLYNFDYAKSLKEKQAKLAELQEEHHEDLAKMESMRSDMSYNKEYLETIETLSLKMLSSNSVDGAQQLQLELKEITKELRRL